MRSLVAVDAGGVALALGELLCAGLRRACSRRWEAMCRQQLQPRRLPAGISSGGDPAAWRAHVRRFCARGGTVRFRMHTMTGAAMELTVRRLAPLRRAVFAYCHAARMPQTLMRFVLAGLRVDLDATPEQLELQDGDSIVAMMELLGD